MSYRLNKFFCKYRVTDKAWIFSKVLISYFISLMLSACSLSIKERIEKRVERPQETCSFTQNLQKGCSEMLAKTIQHLKLINPCLRYSKDKNMDNEIETYSSRCRLLSEKEHCRKLRSEREYRAQQRVAEFKQSNLEKTRPGTSHKIKIKEKIDIPI